MINLYIIDYFKQRTSGLTTYVDQLQKYLHKNKRVNLHFIFVRATSYICIQKEKIGNSVHYHIPHDIGPSTNVEQDKQFIDFLRQDIREKQTIFHFNWINHAPFAQVLRKAFPCKIVLTKHCIPWRDTITNNYPLFRLLNQQFLSKNEPFYLDDALLREQLAYQDIDHIICVTKLAQKSLSRLFGFPQDNVSIIYNGLPSVKMKMHQKKVLKSKYGFNSEERIILYAGAINERKGVYDLVVAFDKILKRITNIRLVIAGIGDLGKVCRSTEKNWAKVTVTGVLDKKTLYDFYQMAEIGVVPSYIEQCSYTAIEMMHHRLPVVVSNVDGLAEIVPDGCGLKVPLVLGKTKAQVHRNKLAEHIVYLLENQETAAEYATKAKQHALKNLNGEKMATATFEVYEKLLNQDETLLTHIETLGKDALVSVLLTSQNTSEYMKACIESVLEQTYSNFELLVINDGSTKATRTLVESYMDKRIRLINHDDGGIASSLSRGIQEAKGRYITLIDVDDRMHPNRLIKQVRFLEKEENKDIGFIGSNHYVMNADGKVVNLQQFPVTNEEIKVVSMFRSPFSQSSVMVRTNLICNNKNHFQHPHISSHQIWFELLKTYKGGNIPEYLTYYRIRNRNLLGKDVKEQQENIMELVLDELERLGIDPSVDELKIHLAITQGYGIKIFNTLEKKDQLRQWIDKVLFAVQKRDNYSDKLVKRIKTYIEQICRQMY